jgi:hypothetical protein
MSHVPTAAVHAAPTRSRRPRAARRILAGAALAGTLAAAVGAPAATAAPVTITLWPAGQGRIDLAQGAARHSCDFSAVVGGSGCTIAQLDDATPVTVTATAEPDAERPANTVDELPDFPVTAPVFVRWSRWECGISTTCTFIPSQDDWLTAVFSPLQLDVRLNGIGRVDVQRPDGGSTALICEPSNAVTSRCHGLQAAGVVVLVAKPDNPQDPIAWGPGCEPAAGNPASATCAVAVSNLRTIGLVAFGAGTVIPDLPFVINPKVKVAKGGSGTGSVTGSGFSCGQSCAVTFDYQQLVRLSAREAAGSHFVRWVGVCARERSCAFNAGSATNVRAVFDRNGDVPPRKRAFDPKISVLRRGRGANRTIVVVAHLDRPARLKVRLLRGSRTVAVGAWSVPAGDSKRRLRVPRAAPPGRYLVRVGVSAGSDSETRTYRRSLKR